jgi:hypothetical protein
MMARRVFFSFHYSNDINRSMTVRNKLKEKKLPDLLTKQHLNRSSDKVILLYIAGLTNSLKVHQLPLC